MSDERDDNLLEFKKPEKKSDGAPPDVPLPLSPIIDLEIRRRDYCSHEVRNQVLVNEHQRTVECACGAFLDPFDVLLHVARERQNRIWHHKHLQQETQKVQARLDALKRLESNCRARIKRMTAKLPAVEEVGGCWLCYGPVTTRCAACGSHHHERCGHDLRGEGEKKA